MLQWSHVFSDMVSEVFVPATIGSSSLQWSHVFSDMVRRPRTTGSRTTGTLQWSHVFSDMVRMSWALVPPPDDGASMEPCLFRHGKLLLRRARGCMAADASMEPCLFRHGKCNGTVITSRIQKASMEPCLFRHGKRTSGATSPGR